MNQKVEFETTKNPRLKTLAIEIITPPDSPFIYKQLQKPTIAKKETIENNFTKLLALSFIEKYPEIKINTSTAAIKKLSTINAQSICEPDNRGDAPKAKYLY